MCRLLYCCDSSSLVSEGHTEKCLEERCPGKKNSQFLYKVFGKGCKIGLINVSINKGGYTTSVPIEMLTNTGQWFVQTRGGQRMSKYHRFTQFYAEEQMTWNSELKVKLNDITFCCILLIALLFSSFKCHQNPAFVLKSSLFMCSWGCHVCEHPSRPHPLF